MKKYIGFIALALSVAVLNVATADQDQATSWLSQQQKVSGEIFKQTDVANSDQSTQEAALAFLGKSKTLYSFEVNSALAFLGTQNLQLSSTESISRRVLLKTQLGLSVNNEIQELSLRLNRDGGFGDYPNYDSTPLTSSFALMSLRAAKTEARSTVDYLVRTQNANGSWLFPNFLDSSNPVTAYAFSALFQYRNEFNLSSNLDASAAFLLSQRQNNGLWADTETSLLSLIVLVQSQLDRTPFQNSISALQNQQLANGSLDNDVYLTSLLVQLEQFLDELPLDAIQVSGRILDADSGLALSSAVIRYRGPSNGNVQSDESGEFNLTLLAPGQYEIEIESAGSSTALFNTSVSKGDRVSLNDVFLSKLVVDPDTQEPLNVGTVRGTIRSDVSGEPLSGVTVSVNQTAELTTQTNDKGEFVINAVPVGSIEIQAALEGYVTQIGSSNLERQQIIIFSPRLNAEPSELVSIFGSVTEQLSGDLLPGVSITASAGVVQKTAVTDSAGTYRISSLPSGQVDITTSLSGYQSTNTQTTTTEGSRIEYSPSLILAGQPGSIFGVVTNNVNNQPIEGANIQVVGGGVTLSATSDNSGSYQIDDVPAGFVQITIGSNGFSAASASAQIQNSGQLEFSVALPEVSNVVTVSGVISDSETGGFLADVLVEVAQGNQIFSGNTNSVGQYQISNISTGELALSATLDGYRVSQGSISTPLGATIDYSPRLTKLVEGEDAKTTLKGVVIDDQSGAPLASALISVEYKDGDKITKQTISNASGAFEFGSLDLGAVVIKIELDGYTLLEINLELEAEFAIDIGFQRLNAVPLEGSSSISAVVVNSVTNEPIEGVLISSSLGDKLTMADGAFTYTSLNAGEFELTFTIDGFNSVEYLVVIENQQDLDLGQIRIRPENVEVLQPDLIISYVSNENVISDLAKGGISGELTLEIINEGTQAIDSGFNVIAFSDLNLNDVFDSAVDEVLGESTFSQTLAINDAQSISIDISGNQEFRDAPIHTFVDSENRVLESSENNNVASTSEFCKSNAKCNDRVVPLGNPVVKWAWTDSSIEPSYNQVMMTPLVAQANDDNFDGNIDQNDIPDIIFTAHSRATATGIDAPGFIRIISGADGQELRTFTELGPVVEAYGSLAVADIDNDGEIEILAPGHVSGIYAFELDGSLKWYQPDTKRVLIGGITIADLEGDGNVEILAAGSLLDSSGNIIWNGDVFKGQPLTGLRVSYLGAIPLAVDIDLDGVQEVIYGGTVFKTDGTKLWQNQLSPDGLNAVGNFDGDTNPEIVVVYNKKVTLIDHTGATLWSVSTPDGGIGGPPTVADYDNDGKPEIGVAGSIRYTVYDDDGSILWQTATFDRSSSVTGSSVFDFNNDGLVEVVYADQKNIHVFNGANGENIFKLPHSSATTYDYPVIADIDNDGHAEVVVAQNDIYRPGSTPFHGIRVFEEENDSWVGTREIWNQHAYSIDNVNDDGTIPTEPVKGWLTHNSFRLNAFPQCFSGDPVVKWEWNNSDVLGDFAHVVVTPLVGQINDDNQDGVIDSNDSPDVIFSASNISKSPRVAVLRAIDGATGEDIWAVSSPELRVSGLTSQAYGDIDGDGLIEIIAAGPAGNGLLAFEHDGTLKWKKSNITGFPASTPAIVDLDKDGEPEIVYGSRLVDKNGEVLWSIDQGAYDALPLAVNLDNSGGVEVISGDKAFDQNGNLIWDLNLPKLSGSFWGIGVLNAVGNLDDDEFPEIVTVLYRGPTRAASLYVVEHDGEIKYGPVAIPSFGGGPPTLGDFDGDNQIEIGIAASEKYSVFETDGSLKWSAATQDRSSAFTGSSAFDFEDDGKVEILYADELNFRVFDGETGAEIFKIPNASGTFYEYPVVVDIDNDQHAEILVVANDRFGTRNRGIRLFEDANDSWANTRKVWNQHTYHINNINDDGTVPANVEPSWLSHNTYRLNTFTDRRASALPDLTVSRLKLLENGVGQPFTLSVRVGNGGETPSISSVKVDFFRITQSGNGELLTSRNLGVLDEGEFSDLTINNVANLANGDKLMVVVNSSRNLDECDFLNNSMTIPVGAINGGIDVATDNASYSANDAVVITNTIRNTSNFDNIFSVSTKIVDRNGDLVIEFSSTLSELLASDQQQLLSIDWNTENLLAGNYSVISAISSTNNSLLSTSQTEFEILANGLSSPEITLRTTTDKIEYHINESVEIQDLVGNLAVNAIELGAKLNIVVTDPSGLELLNETELVGDLVPLFSNSIIDQLILNNAAIGQYSVVGTVLSNSDTILATDTTQFNVVNNLSISLSGDVIVSNASVFQGETLQCSDRIDNLSTLSISNLKVRQLLLNVDNAQLVNEINSEIAINSSGTANFDSRSIDTTDLPLGNYSCALQALISDEWVNLDNDFFEVLEQPINIELNASVGDKGRVLILLDNASQCTDDPYGPSGALDLATQQAYLENVLNNAGWSYTITMNGDDFVRELRTGGYSNYLLLAEVEHISHFAQKELREAVYRGEGLVEAGKRLKAHKEVNSALGIHYRGQERRSSGIDLLDTEVSSAESVTFTHIDRNVRITAQGAQIVAEYMNGQRSESDHHSGKHWHGYRHFRGHSHYWCPPTQPTSPAVTLNEFGLGKSIYMGFDLLSEASSMGGEDNIFSTLLLNALETVNPEPPLTTTGSDYPIVFTVTNAGSATPAQFVLPISDGISIVDAGNGIVNADVQTITWPLNLAEGEVVEILLWVEMPSQNTVLEGRVFSGAEGSLVERAIASIELVPEALISIDDVIESTSQARALYKTKRSLKYARWYQAKGYQEHALRSLLIAANHVAHIQKRYESENLTALRVNIGILIRQTAKQLSVPQKHHRCVVRGNWYKYNYPKYPKSCRYNHWNKYSYKLSGKHAANDN